MADVRFFQRSGPFQLGLLAEHAGADLSHPAFADLLMHDLATLDTAGPGDISLFSSTSYQQAAASSGAGAIVTTRKLGDLLPDSFCLLYVTDPRLAFTLIGSLFYPRNTREAGIHSTAFIDVRSIVGEGQGSKHSADFSFSQSLSRVSRGRS
jgi:UDP-3-O-[3-hydroxymyristoyl] glucosamine N-acyltransferase